MHAHNFRAASHAVKIHSGQDALALLPAELDRLGVRRALVLCGRTVHRRTGLVRRIIALCDARVVGVFDAIEAGASRAQVEAAAEMARSLDADCLVAVGAGSVTKAARVVAILMAESRPLQELATRYDAAGRGHSVRLDAPKCAIVNVLTAATSSQNRGGASIRDDALPHQLEFFDPKTRPRAIFWDADALETAPESLLRSAMGMELWWSLMGMASVEQENALVQSSRLHGWRLSRGLSARPLHSWDWRQRIDLCAASYLRTRDEDDGGAPLGGSPMRAHLITRATYMLGAALFNGRARINQAQAMLALTPAAIRVFGPLCPEVVAQLGEALGVPGQIEDTARACEACFSPFAKGADLRQAALDAQDIQATIAYALRVFNCNADGLMNDKAHLLRRMLETVVPQACNRAA